MIKEQLSHVIDLFFPDLCPGCEDLHRPKDSMLCPICYTQVNFSETQDYPYDNELISKFYDKPTPVSGVALFDMDVNSIEERLVYQIKYSARQDIGRYLGGQLGKRLLDVHQVKQYDMIIPVPLHSSKLRKRGFNQSEVLAIGIANELGIPVNTSTLIRVKNTKTQTRMSKEERLVNVGKAFKLSNLWDLSGQHILLVDDVVTTGSTSQACFDTLAQIPEVKLSICCVGLPIDF